MTVWISALGDTALLAPASLALLAYLAILRRWRSAWAFAVTLAVGGTVTVLSKLLFNACGASISDLDVISPSGHASFATMVYGALAVLVGYGRPARSVLPLAVATTTLVAAIAASRVRLESHSPAEVVFGLAIGVSALAIFVRLRGREAEGPLSPAPLAVGFVVALLLLGGRHFTPEGHIARLARDVSARFDICRDGPARQTSMKALRYGP